MTIDEAKNSAMELDSMEITLTRIPVLLKGFYDGSYDLSGFVVWDARGNVNVDLGNIPYSEYRKEIMLVVEMALGYCRTNGRDEWIVAGPGVLPFLRTYPGFVDIPSRSIGDSLYVVGRVGVKTVIANPLSDLPHRFFVGTQNKYAMGIVENSPSRM